MYRSYVFLILCLCVTFGQSTNLPNREKSKIIQVMDDIAYKSKIDECTIKLLSYNTWGLPISLIGHDQDVRFPIMADSILDLDKDIICLQETFHPRLRAELLSVLPKYYYTFSDYRCNKDIIPFLQKDCHGGLMTFSKFPIISETFYPYPTTEHTSMIEKIGAKGFLMSTIQYGETKLNIINTHLYAGDDANSEMRRYEQIAFMYNTIQNLDNYKLHPTLLFGDFNVNHPDVEYSETYQFIINKMGYEDSKKHITSEDFTSDHSQNRYVKSDEKSSKLDYIFYQQKCAEDITIIEQSKALAGKNPLSDHYGWAVTLRLNNEITSVLSNEN